MAFFILLGYALARPAAESLFLAAHGTRALPYAWLGVMALSFPLIGLYQHLARSLPLGRLFARASLISAAVLCLLLLSAGRKESLFGLYLWKDLYIVVLLEMFWSMADVLCDLSSARRTYGFFCAMGALGGILGNLGGGALALRIGTQATLWLVLPLLALPIILLPREASARPNGAQGRPQKSALSLLARSDYLLLLLALLGVVQLVITLIDYQFNLRIEKACPHLDDRTALIGRVYAAIDAGSLLLQALTGPTLRLLGEGRTLLCIPSLLGLCALSAWVHPALSALIGLKVLSKCMDYSLFRAAKELLYIPLSYEEKTRGKALIDMLTYRVAKGLASLLLLGLSALSLGPLLTALMLCLIVLWLGLTLIIVPRYRRKVGGASRFSDEEG